MLATQEIKLEKIIPKWPTKKLSEVCKILDNKRKPINSSERETRIANKLKSSLFPYYGATGQVGYIDDYLIEGEYVLLGEDGAPFLESFKDKAYLVHGKIWVNNHAHILLANGSNKFLCYYLNQINYREFVSGTTRLKLNQSMMREIPVLDPPLPEQHRIVQKIEELFSELDYAITTLKTTQQQLQTYRQSVLKHAFEGHFTGGMKGWNNVRLADVADLKGGVTKGKKLDGKPTINLPYLRVANVQDGYLDLTEIKQIQVEPADLEKYRLIENDILFTEGGDKDKLGRGTIWRNQIKDCIHQNHIFRARVKKEIILPKFLEYITKTQKSRTYFYKVAKQTTNLASINMTQLSNLEFEIPDLKKQEIILNEIETRLSESDYLLQTINQQLTHAESLRQSVLQRAFSGEL